MAGLAAAAALADVVERVTVLERDRLRGEEHHRKGVPQDRHLHLLLPAGAAALAELLPGLPAEFRAAGAVTGDADRMRIAVNGHRLARARTGHEAVFASRPRVEAVLRRRVEQLAAVTIRDGCAARGLVTSADGGGVVGVELAAPRGGPGGATLDAGLVVDCTGRGSRTPAWLADLGYEQPETDELAVEVTYVTRTFALPADVLAGDHHVLVGPTSDRPRGGAMTRVGPQRWLVTLFAMGDERPPEEAGAFRRYARRLAIRDIHDALGEGEPVGDRARYRFVADTRRRYERLGRFPDGLVVAGDAVCSFNPIYGQGMSVAALEALTLRRLARRGRIAPAEWFDAITPTVEAAWQLTTGADLAVDEVAGHRPMHVRVANAYLRHLHAAAATDAVLSARFARVAALLDPPTALLRPANVGRVVRRRTGDALRRVTSS